MLISVLQNAAGQHQLTTSSQTNTAAGNAEYPPVPVSHKKFNLSYSSLLFGLTGTTRGSCPFAHITALEERGGPYKGVRQFNRVIGDAYFLNLGRLSKSPVIRGSA